MNVEAPPREQQTGDLIPWDLTEWIDSAILLNWILEEIETFEWDRPEVEQLLRKNPAFRPKELLALLTYAYTTKTYEADLVCDLLETERHLAPLARELEATPDMVAKFRKENRGILRWLMMKVFKRALWHHHDIAESDFIPAGLKQYFAQAANTRMDLARHMDRTTHT